MLGGAQPRATPRRRPPRRARARTPSRACRKPRRFRIEKSDRDWRKKTWFFFRLSFPSFPFCVLFVCLFFFFLTCLARNSGERASALIEEQRCVDSELHRKSERVLALEQEISRDRIPRDQRQTGVFCGIRKVSQVRRERRALGSHRRGSIDQVWSAALLYNPVNSSPNRTVPRDG